MKSTEKKQLRASEFRKKYDIPSTTFHRWIHSKGIVGKVAFKIGGLWYIDIPAYEKWRALQHTIDYKYA